jgi:hypothetical protein
VVSEVFALLQAMLYRVSGIVEKPRKKEMAVRLGKAL